MSRPPLHLLDLPIEILTLILRPLLTTRSNAPIPICGCCPAPFAHPFCVLPILLTHPRLHAIATPLLYGPEREFLLDLTGGHHARARREFEEDSTLWSPLSLPLRRGSVMSSRDALRRVGRLSVRLDRLRGWMTDRVVPLVADMILRGQLAMLDVFLATDASVPTSPLRHAKHLLGYDPVMLVPGSPLAGIMGLLADPYLRSARMYIQVGHMAEWCRFHEGGRGEECSENGGDDRVMEVDWRGMIREADPAGELFPFAKALGERAGG